MFLSQRRTNTSPVLPYNLLLLLTWYLPLFLRTAQAAAPGTNSAAFHILDRHSKIGASSATPTRSALCLLRLSQFQRTWEGRGDGCGGGAGSADGADVAGPRVIMPRPFPFPGPGSFSLCEACSAASLSHVDASLLYYRRRFYTAPTTRVMSTY